MKKYAVYLVYLLLAAFILSSCAAKTNCSSKSKKGQSKKVQKFMGYKR